MKWAIAILCGILLCLQGLVLGELANVQERVARLERIATGYHADLGRLEESCLARQAVVDAYQESVRITQEGKLDKMVAWLQRATRGR